MSSVFQEVLTPSVRRLAEYHRRAHKDFICANGDAEALCNTLWGSDLVGYGGPFCPTCRDVEKVRNWGGLDGTSLVRANYRTMRKVGVALVRSGRFEATAMKMEEDLDGKRIEGFFYRDNTNNPSHMRRYEVVSGSPRVYTPRGVVTIETCYTKMNLDRDWKLLGKVNKSPMSKLGLGKEQLLVLGFPFSRYWREDNHWYVDYTGIVDHVGHNSRLKVRELRPYAVEIPAVDVTGTPNINRARHMILWLPQVITGANHDQFEPTPLEDRRVYETGDLSWLDEMILWP